MSHNEATDIARAEAIQLLGRAHATLVAGYFARRRSSIPREPTALARTPAGEELLRYVLTSRSEIAQAGAEALVAGEAPEAGLGRWLRAHEVDA